MDALLARGDLAGRPLPHAVRGELFARLGRPDEARAEFTLSLDGTCNDDERRVLQRKLDALP